MTKESTDQPAGTREPGSRLLHSPGPMICGLSSRCQQSVKCPGVDILVRSANGLQPSSLSTATCSSSTLCLRLISASTMQVSHETIPSNGSTFRLWTQTPAIGSHVSLLLDWWGLINSSGALEHRIGLLGFFG